MTPSPSCLTLSSPHSTPHPHQGATLRGRERPSPLARAAEESGQSEEVGPGSSLCLLVLPPPRQSRAESGGVGVGAKAEGASGAEHSRSGKSGEGVDRPSRLRAGELTHHGGRKCREPGEGRTGRGGRGGHRGPPCASSRALPGCFPGGPGSSCSSGSAAGTALGQGGVPRGGAGRCGESQGRLRGAVASLEAGTS